MSKSRSYRAPYRVQVKTAVYPVVRKFIGVRARDAATRATVSLLSHFRKTGGNVEILWDTQSVPNTLADIVPAFILAKILDANGVRVKFVVRTGGGYRWGWFHPLSPAPEEIVTAWSQTFELLLPKPRAAEFVLSQEMRVRKSRDVTHRIQSDSVLNVTEYCAGILRELSNYATELDLSSIYLDDLGSTLRRNSFVAWHVRHSQRQPLRGGSPSQLLADYLELNSLGKDIVLFSDPAGQNYVEEVFDECYGKQTPWGKNLTPQKSGGFVAAIPEILSADAYFHRFGGGMGIFPIFSRIPYFIQDKNPGLFTKFRTNPSSFAFQPWSTPAQVYYSSRARELDATAFGEFAKYL